MNLRAKLVLKTVDHGWNELRKAMKEAAHAHDYAKAGVLGGAKRNRTKKAGEKGHLDNVALALVHEFGTTDGHVPARSFVLSAFNENRAEYKNMLRKLLPKVYEGKMSIKTVLGLIGARMSADQKNRITHGAGIPPPLALSTIARKKSSRPLVDTGQLLNSLTWIVVSSETSTPSKGKHHT